MRTIYIDVYFLINFTVDLLAIHFASRFSKVPIKSFRMICAAIIGGIYAVVTVIIPQNILIFIGVGIISLILITLICTFGTSFLRKLKFIIAFLLFLVLIGGMVYYAFTFIDNHITLTESDGIIENRTLLLLSITVLLSMGIIKLLFIIFDGATTEKNVKIKITLKEKSIVLDAFVDSGNLAKDPIDMSPVLFIKKSAAEKLFNEGIPEFYDGKVNDEYKSYIRLIPIKTKDKTEIIYGLRADCVSVIKGKKEERIKITIAFDNEGGTYGGYEALMPISALENL